MKAGMQRMGGVFRRVDLFGLAVFVALVGLVAAAIYAALAFGWFKSWWELAACCAVAGAFIAVGLGARAPEAPKNTQVHGAAKPASEAEAQAAARGDFKSAVHDQTFPD